MHITPNYHQDFYAWLLENAQFMRDGTLDKIDVPHLIEELEAMAKSERRELLSRLAVLLMHLLKWQYQPDKITRSWKNTIITQRIEIAELLEDSPSLKAQMSANLQAAYNKAKIKAEDETGIDQQHFPKECPFALEQILADGFFPNSSLD